MSPRAKVLHATSSLALALATAALLAGCQSAPRNAAAPGAIGPLTLGEPPLCEASGAIRAPWDEELVLVADNEISDRLFRFRVDHRGLLEATGELAIPVDHAPDDIEAMAQLDQQLILVGSHGRGGSCTLKPPRQRIQALAIDPAKGTVRTVTALDSSPHWQAATDSVEACLEAFIAQPTVVHARQFCAALVHAEQPAGFANCRCFDIEGAVGVGDAAGRRQLWLGLRQPRVNGHAVLLRMTPGLARLQFDRIVLIPADRGIRSLAVHAGHLWAILGPAAPTYATSCLWRTPLAELQTANELAGTVVADDLPPAAEGMVFTDRHVLIVTDGESPTPPGATCIEPARQIALPLP